MMIRFLDEAEAELAEVIDWYNAQTEGLGDEFIREFDATVRRIVANPEAYASLEEGVRRALVKRFPYGAIYGYDSNKQVVAIVAVAHLHREPGYWVGRGGSQ